MLFASREKYHAKEQDFASNISSAEENITQFLRLANVNNENDLPQALKVEVRKIREMIYPLKEELRKIRLQMRQGVDELFQTALLLNLLTGPVFTAVFIVIFRSFRRTFQRVGKL